MSTTQLLVQISLPFQYFWWTFATVALLTQRPIFTSMVSPLHYPLCLRCIAINTFYKNSSRVSRYHSIPTSQLNTTLIPTTLSPVAHHILLDPVTFHQNANLNTCWTLVSFDHHVDLFWASKLHMVSSTTTERLPYALHKSITRHSPSRNLPFRFHFPIYHRSKENTVADALSRISTLTPSTEYLDALATV